MESKVSYAQLGCIYLVEIQLNSNIVKFDILKKHFLILSLLKIVLLNSFEETVMRLNVSLLNKSIKKYNSMKNLTDCKLFNSSVFEHTHIHIYLYIEKCKH